MELSLDAVESMEELLDKPLSGPLDAALFGEIAADAVSRHLEPLLTAENAEAFADEVKRRVPLAKEVQNKVGAADFANRSAEQLQRALIRLVERGFEVMPPEDFKRVIRNLGWFTEKDEKRRQSALTDMGTLIAEREAITPAFTDPENFLDTLIAGEILTDEEAAIVQRAQPETPNASLAAVIDRVLRLPAERRRRLSEAKLQEVQPVLDQAIRAHALYQREVHYVIDTNPESGKREIVIVDEFTGRKMPGRRYSEGLHEALEAKHGLEVQLESQTVATITIQNYFRLYHKLAGMTGTAKTEEAEFAKTYGMEVVSIPTNRTIRRMDAPDVVYKTAEAKVRAITFEILEHHCAGQPVLVGTRSVEVSERMAERLKPQPLQALVLAHLIKTKLWENKDLLPEQRDAIMAAMRLPIGQLTQEQAKELRDKGIRPEPLNLMQVKNAAKLAGLPPDALHEENVNKLLSLFTVPNVDRSRLETALRVGLPHNVLNAKNHRNEARIIAEAARPAAVTIATNMAGRGVDIVLGGTLDVESRWRVTTQQVLARYLDGKPVHVRSRNQEATDKLVDRLSPQRLQDLAWLVGVSQRVDELEHSGALEGQAAKEIRDTLGQDLTTSDLKNKVRSRARRLGLLEKLPLDADPLQDDGPLHALNASLKRLVELSFDTARLREALQSGVPTESTGRDIAEVLLLHTLSRPLAQAQEATGKLLEVLNNASDLDRALLEAAAEAGAHRLADFDTAQLSQQVSHVTPEWVTSRLRALNVHDSPSARHKLQTLHAHDIEVNEAQLTAALGEATFGVQWLRERLRGWHLIKGERAYEAPPEMQELLGDTAVVHYRLDQEAARKLWEAWQSDPAQRRDLTLLEVPNLILLSEMAQMLGGEAPFLHPEWLHHQFMTLGMIGEDDVFEAQMAGQAEDEHGNVREVPIDVLVYRLQLSRVLPALNPTLREAVAKVGHHAEAVREYLQRNAAWATPFIDIDWVAERLREVDTEDSALSTQDSTLVLIETGVAGQSADIVLESEPRPEDIAHTSEQELVKTLGGLHIVGTERHESRRIDNQLRGRAGRQGDPGSSRFYVSLEDELWRLFGVRGQWMLNKWDEDEPVEHGMISKSIERAQKKVELNHFESRKHVLQYDDVMNVQREVIYRERRRALMGGDLRDTVLDMAQQAAMAEAEKHCPKELRLEEWDAHKLYLSLSRLFGATLLGKHLPADELEAMHSREEMDDRLKEVVEACYSERENQLGSDTMRALERWQVTRSIDDHWMEHLAEMDYLRDAIWQEGYAQKEPIGVYRQEGFALFQKMLNEIRREVTEAIFSTQVGQQRQQPVYEGPQVLAMQEARLTQTLPMDHLVDDSVQLDKDAEGEDEDEPAVIARTTRASAGPAPITQTSSGIAVPPVASPVGPRPSGAHGGAKVGRNDPCPCGSGKKYKKCCLPKEQGVTV
ncbi:MAG: SEC-C metal-binding domain-containing protein [Armatimonadota bacterium]|nr:SEC-C metal-binding domain-containing protein [Armatimonadota bacterium]